MLKNAESHGHRESNTGGHWEDIGEEETDYGTLLTALLGSSTHHTAQTDEHARVLHKPMTLDQYYYASLDDTSKRDETQVVFRYFFREKKKEEEEAMREAEKAKDKEKKTGGVRRNNTDLHKRNGELIAELEIQSRNLLYGHKHASESNSSQNDDTDDQILMVDQLWLWITDDSTCLYFTVHFHSSLTRRPSETIITSTTKQTKQYDDAVLQNIVSYLVDSSSKGLSRPESVEMLMRLAIGTATEFLRDNKIKVAGNKTKTPMEIFQESIRYVVCIN